MACRNIYRNRWIWVRLICLYVIFCNQKGPAHSRISFQVILTFTYFFFILSHQKWIFIDINWRPFRHDYYSIEWLKILNSKIWVSFFDPFIWSKYTQEFLSAFLQTNHIWITLNDHINNAFISILQILILKPYVIWHDPQILKLFYNRLLPCCLIVELLMRHGQLKRFAAIRRPLM